MTCPVCNDTWVIKHPEGGASHCPRCKPEWVAEEKKVKPTDHARAKELVCKMMDEYPDRYAERGCAFRVEFFTDHNTGAMIAAMWMEMPLFEGMEKVVRDDDQRAAS
jgi:hypothetical protein